MSDPAVTVATPTFVPDQRPVKRFVAAIAAATVVLAASWWSGAVAPRVSVPCAIGRVSELGVSLIRILVRNEGPLPVDITDVSITDDHIEVVAVRLGKTTLTPQGGAIGAGEEVIVELEVVARSSEPTATSEPSDVRPPDTGVDLTLRTIVGIERTQPTGVAPYGHPSCTAGLIPSS